jgi:DNA-directed RNA polymerase subunit RPC12/RpoP
MTKRTADHRCASCGSLLVPPQLAAEFRVPPQTDYVCLRCGRPYRWIGNPPALRTIVTTVPRVDHLSDDSADL